MQVKSKVVSKSVFTVVFPNTGKSLITMFLSLAIACSAVALSVTPSQAAKARAVNPKYAGIVVDAKTGNVLYSENADALRYPASLTKMMTLYMTFEALEAGRIRLDSPVPVSAHAASEPPSKLGVRAGGTITVEQAILALVTRSANDAATALGEFVGGSEGKFAQMMTSKARALGMTRTTYRNANGLPNTAQMTTARDQARLGIALRQHFPQYYGYFSTRSFRYGKQVIGNHNRLLGAVRGVDGIKTGYTRAAGFNLVTSAQADGRSVVGVVLGGTSGGQRDAQMKQLVGRYLPEASRRGSGKLIAETRSQDMRTEDVQPVAEIEETTPLASAALSSTHELPVNGPVPDTRYDAAVETAYASTAKSSTNPIITQSAVKNLAEARVAIPRPAPEYIPETEEGDTSASVDALTTSSTKDASGWVIQVGVSPTKQSAMTLLQSAQDKGGKVLRSATPFAVAINAGSEQVYRARFGGFDNQKSAVGACTVLKRKGINCWASLQ